MIMPSEILEPIPGPNPCGEWLRYDPVYDQIKEARRDEVAHEGPGDRKRADYDLVIRLATDVLATRSKDLQIAAWLAEAWIFREGFQGLLTGIRLVRVYLERYWDHVHPEPDENDHFARAAVLNWLNSAATMAVYRMPLNKAGHNLQAYIESRTVPTEEAARLDSESARRRADAIRFRQLLPEEFDAASAVSERGFLHVRLADVGHCLRALEALERVVPERFTPETLDPDFDPPTFEDLREALQKFSDAARAIRQRVGASEPSEASAWLGSAGMERRKPDPDAPQQAPEAEPVRLGASAPATAAPGDGFAAAFVAYIGEIEEEVRAQLKELGPAARAQLGLASCRWRPGIVVLVRVSGRHLQADPVEAEFTWDGRRQLIVFAVTVDDDAPESTTVLKFEVFVAGFRVAVVPVTLAIRPGKAGTRLIRNTVAPYRTAFASYASEDRDEVLARVASVSAGAGIDVFLDCLSLHPGEEWKRRLRDEIVRRDVFYLFWCRHARSSEWVSWEWRTALAEKGLSAIQPHPLAVADAEPPEELRALHFNDPFLLARTALPRSSPGLTRFLQSLLDRFGPRQRSHH